MTPADAEQLIRHLRRDIGISRAARGLLGSVFVIGLAASMVTPEDNLRFLLLSVATMSAAIAWSVLAVISRRQVLAANQANMLIATGRPDLAERQLHQSLKFFSIYGGSKLMVCHNLAVIAHSRGDYAAAARLCAGVLSFPRRFSRAARHTTRILLADCRLLLNDLAGVAGALAGLSIFDTRLALAQRLMLLPIQLRYETAAGHFTAALERLPERVKLAELLETPRAALVHGLLALACQKTDRPREAAYLTARAALYHDLPELSAHFPMLAELHP